MKALNITIAGITNTGKTSIANKLASVLSEYGIKCTINDFDDGVPEIEKCLKSLGEQELEVFINVVQLRRGHLHD